MKYIDLKHVFKLPSLSSLLSEVIDLKVVLRGERKQRARTLKDKVRKANMPFKLLPNARSFEIHLRPIDWLYSLFGMTVRFAPKISIEPGANYPANAFVYQMFCELGKLRDRGRADAYWAKAWRLMNSQAYQLMCYNHVRRRWYKDLPLGRVRRELRQVKDLVMARSTHIRESRVYLPKNEYTVRPLTVPTPAWRVYLNMYANLLVWYRLGSEGEHQHGFIPGRGVLTAWKRILELIDRPHIYEFDLERFFDSVFFNAILNELLKIGVPSREREFLKAIHHKPPEPLAHVPMAQAVTWHADQLARRVADLKLLGFIKGGKPQNVLVFGGMVQVDWGEEFPTYSQRLRGVPQGAATSCVISTLVLRRIERMYDTVLYADDGLIFPPTAEVPTILNKGAGYYPKESASGWVKQSGKWQKPLKFLGFEYIPPALPGNFPEEAWVILFLMVVASLTIHPLIWLGVGLFLYAMRLEYKYSRPVFRASTRKGSTLEFDEAHQFLAYLLEARDLATKYVKPKLGAFRGRTLEEFLQHHWARFSLLRWSGTWRLLWTSKRLGLFASRMQAGEWESDQWASFRLRVTPGSWAHLSLSGYCARNDVDRSEVTIFSVSTFACHDILQRKSFINR